MSTPWFKTDLSADGGQLFQQLVAAANSGGAKEIFALDASGELWHAYEHWEYISFEIGDRRYSARRIGWVGPNGKIWQPLSKFSQKIVDFAVTTDQYGGLNIFAMAANQPASTGWLAQQSPGDPTSWSGNWTPMQPLPFGPHASVFAQTYHMGAQNVSGMMVVCYLANPNPEVQNLAQILYDFQVQTPSGMRWASAQSGGLQTAAALPAGEGSTLTLSNSGGPNMLIQSTNFSFFISSFNPIAGTWSAPTPIPAAGVTYPGSNNNTIPNEGSLTTYPGGLLAFFIDQSGAMTLLRQELGVAYQSGPFGAPYPVPSVNWLGSYQNVLPANTCDWNKGFWDGPLAVSEDPVADQGSAATHQLVFFLNTTSPSQKLLQALPFSANPSVPGSIVAQPLFYSPGPAITIDPAPPPKFDYLTLAVNAFSGISLFSMGLNTGTVNCWQQIPPQIF